MFKNILFLIFICTPFIQLNAQQLRFKSITLISSKSTFLENFISFKQHGKKTYLLTRGDYLSGNIELMANQSTSQISHTRSISLDKELKFNSSLGSDPIIDFDLSDSLFFILTQKRIIGYTTDSTFSSFEKIIELNLHQVSPGNEKMVKSPFQKINFCGNGNALTLSRFFIRNLGDPKVCLVKLFIHRAEDNSVSLERLNYYVSENLSYSSDAMSLASGVIHYALSNSGKHAIIKNGFIPSVTFLDPHLKEIKTTYLNLYDTLLNTTAVNKVQQASHKYISKNSTVNFNSLTLALDSSFYVHTISFINDTTLLVQIQNPHLSSLYHSFIVTLNSYFFVNNIREIIEFKLDNFTNEPLLATNFPTWFSNLPYITGSNSIYVIKETSQEINLNASLVRDFFVRKSASENNFYYLITYQYK